MRIKRAILLLVSASLSLAPGATAGEPPRCPTHHISIDRDGGVVVGGKRYTAPEDLRRALRRLRCGKNLFNIVATVDIQTRYDAAAKGLALLQRTGEFKIGFVNMQESDRATIGVVDEDAK